MELAQSGQCQAALDTLAQSDASDVINQLPARLQIEAYTDAMVCANRLHQGELALKYAVAGTALPEAPSNLWQGRFALDWNGSHHEATIVTLEIMATQAPAALRALSVDSLDRVYRGIGGDEQSLRDRFIRVIGAPNYVPDEDGRSVDGYRYADALLQIKDGHRAAAAAAFAPIRAPVLLMRASLDPRLSPFLPRPFSARAAVERQLVSMQALSARNPNALAPINELADAYNNLDDGQSMLKILLSVSPDQGLTAPNGSRSDVLTWWRLTISAYQTLGRYEDVLSAIRSMGAVGAVRANDPSLPIDVAGKQLHFGHAEAALATLAPLAGAYPGALNAYGEMQWRLVHGCASYVARQDDQAQADLAYVRAHGQDAPSALTPLLMCMHHDDEVAATVIAALADPEKRAAELLSLSTFAPYPEGYPIDAYMEGQSRIKERPDVQAAIAKAGGPGHFDVPPL